MKIASIILVVLSMAAITVADENGKDQQLIKQWYSTYDQIKESFSLYKQAGDGQWLEVAAPDEPAMTLLAPDRHRHGRVWVWTDGEKPVAIGCVWSVVAVVAPSVRNITLEFHSLSDNNVRVQRNGAVEWQTHEPGIKWLDVADVGPPPMRESLLLTRMRAIARSNASGKEAGIKGAPAQKHRLLPQPILRYSDSVRKAVGAVFVYADGTDPQVFLLLEAVGGKWKMAFARSNLRGLYVDRNAERIWASPRAEPFVRTNPFFIYFRAERRSASDPAEILAVAGQGDLRPALVEPSPTAP